MSSDGARKYTYGGGVHLGVVRSWMQRKFRNGDRVTWGSHNQHLTGTHLTPLEFEHLAIEIAEAVFDDAVKDHVWAVLKKKEGVPLLFRERREAIRQAAFRNDLDVVEVEVHETPPTVEKSGNCPNCGESLDDYGCIRCFSLGRPPSKNEGAE